ncbi:hypothetical protein A0H81_02169 [Grifola frondosa]|uniref:Uncharacterized protein n=1 Tax=Grifola frondosa TaxID=5627 RepID=A0A1C7MNH8_GRIFR|nr:hypothetical protein A0H81_02169 [Grifola frondosa]
MLDRLLLIALATSSSVSSRGPSFLNTTSAISRTRWAPRLRFVSSFRGSNSSPAASLQLPDLIVSVDALQRHHPDPVVCAAEEVSLVQQRERLLPWRKPVDVAPLLSRGELEQISDLEADGGHSACISAFDCALRHSGLPAF